MGLFDFLFGNSGRKWKATIEPDVIWLSQQAKWNAVADQLHQCGDALAILLVAHFQETLAELQAIADQHKGPTPVQATLVEQLKASQLPLSEDATIVLIAGERHFLRSEDERLLEFAEQLPCQCRVTYHLSLDDPLMQLFSGESTKAMLLKMGKKENEAIESKMVSRRIQTAQQRIAKSALGNKPAASAAQWLELNLPGR